MDESYWRLQAGPGKVHVLATGVEEGKPQPLLWTHAGAKGRVGLGRSHWFLNYYGDVGGGTSDLTWQAAGGFGYALSWGYIVLDFRYLKYSPGGNTKLLRDLELYGPHLGFGFHF